jgi:hypothetical protein
MPRRRATDFRRIDAAVATAARATRRKAARAWATATMARRAVRGRRANDADWNHIRGGDLSRAAPPGDGASTGSSTGCRLGTNFFRRAGRVR